nr:hypothetical protein HmN_000426500 [Hymenolepis microstoma]
MVPNGEIEDIVSLSTSSTVPKKDEKIGSGEKELDVQPDKLMGTTEAERCWHKQSTSRRQDDFFDMLEEKKQQHPNSFPI